MTPFVAARCLVFKAAARALRPKERLTVDQWADAHRVLTEEGSAEPGRWKTSRTPYLREIMGQLSEASSASFVAFMAASQIGKTECSSNWLGYIMSHAKGPVAVVMPTDKSLGDWMSQKFDPMAAATPAVAAVLKSKSNKASNNNAERKRFVGGMLYCKTAGSTADLKSTSLRYAIADELDEWDWTTLQGDPLGLLQVRLSNFHDHKLFAVSSPTVKDASRIEEAFDAGDRRRYHVPCPHCDELQALKWANVRWSADQASPRLIRRAWYACEHCGAEIEEHDKPTMLARGRWIAEAPGSPHPSYHLSSIYSPIGLGRSWAQLATEWISAQGDPARLMRFCNTRLGETWADRTRDIKPNALQARAEPYALRSIPVGCLLLTAGIDSQDDRLEIQVTGHGKGDRTWCIDYHVIPGNPAEQSIWDSLTEYLNKPFTNAFGQTMRIEASAIDSGGHYTHAVYQYVRSKAARRCIAIRGANTPSRILLGRPSPQDVNWRGTVTKRGVSLYLVGTDTAKHLLFSRLNGDSGKDPASRQVHFSDELPVDYYDQMVAETYNPRANRWVKKRGKRNEALDTWVYSIAAAAHPELYSHKWKAADWNRRAAMLEPKAHSETHDEEPAVSSAIADPPAAAPIPTPRTARRKRMVVQRTNNPFATHR